jgi:glycogen phosphorylase
VLAGDHIKSASDLDIPLIGVGLFYGQGYFRQRLDLRRMAAGRIFEDRCQSNGDGAGHRQGRRPVVVEIETRSGRIRAKVWRLKVGRRDLLLLDSDVEGNAPEDRETDFALVWRRSRIRIRQELLLGVGGLRALKALGVSPGVLHLNEGHSAFAVLEAIRMRMEEEGLAFDAAVPRVSREVVLPRILRCRPGTTASTLD